ncbi:hypothetical protein [Flavobacterium sp.]|uniref:hypothetical protein n=1 Tax=Flavobacterium sp. TaxID=239 RepID=UPI00286A7F10|nr:hypothetical protein [Flavobacterium sp.]
MQTTKQTLENIKANGYHIDFGTVFNKAFENYKKIALNAGIAMLLITILMFIVIGIIAVGIVGIAFSTDTLSQFRVENMSPMWLVGYVIFASIAGAFCSPLTAGFIKMAQSAAKGHNYSVGTVFDYYRSKHFKEIVLAALIIAFFSNIFSSGLQWVGFQWIGIVISLSFAVLTFLVIPLIIFGDLKAMEAIEASILIVSKQFFILFGLLIVSGIMVMLGIFGLCIGIFFTIPFIYSMYYCVYSEIIGDETPEIASEEVSNE